MRCCPLFAILFLIEQKAKLKLKRSKEFNYDSEPDRQAYSKISNKQNKQLYLLRPSTTRPKRSILEHIYGLHSKRRSKHRFYTEDGVAIEHKLTDLYGRDAESAFLEEEPNAAGRDPFPQPADHSSRYQDILHLWRSKNKKKQRKLDRSSPRSSSSALLDACTSLNSALLVGILWRNKWIKTDLL